MSTEADRDLELLLADVRRAAARHGAKTIRHMILAFDAHSGVETASIQLADSSGTVTLTAEELRMCERTHLAPADVLKTKAKAIADGVFPPG